MKARVFDKQSSKHKEVELSFQDDNIVIETEGKTRSYPLDSITFSQRLGNMPRSI
jgi:hypothetical protein